MARITVRMVSGCALTGALIALSATPQAQMSHMVPGGGRRTSHR